MDMYLGNRLGEMNVSVRRKWIKVPSIPLEAGEGLFSVRTEDEFKAVVGKMSKRYIRRNMMSLFPFVQYFRQFCETEAYSVVFVPCHGPKWTQEFATPREDGLIVPANPNTVRRAIQVAVKVGLLAVYQQGGFLKTAEGMGLCTKYLYSKKVERFVTAKFREYGITKADFKRVTRSATKARVRKEMSNKVLMDKTDEMKKYELTEETKTLAYGVVLHRIRALMDFALRALLRHGRGAGRRGVL